VVTLREVTGDPEELAALQRIMESDEGFTPRVTGHPSGPGGWPGRTRLRGPGSSRR
jgi:hypothetical protein